MIETKTVEIRDRMTTIPALAIRLDGEDPVMKRAGFYDGPTVLLSRPDLSQVEYDPFSWGSPSRTMQAAHQWLTEHWAEHQDGGVVDVEFILGETKAPKAPEIRR